MYVREIERKKKKDIFKNKEEREKGRKNERVRKRGRGMGDEVMR